EAINNFVREVGVTTATTITDVARLDNHVRDVLNERAPRIMAVMDPVLVVLENLPADHLETVELPNKPRDPAAGSHRVPFTSRLYIDASDFRETSDDQNYFRLAPGKSVGLLSVPHPITLLRIEKDSSGKVARLVCRYENSGDHQKPKTYIQWVADAPSLGSPVRIDEVRLYNPLFMHANPQDKTAVPGGFLSDVNPHSLVIIQTAIAEVGLATWIRDHQEHRADPEAYHFQFVRVGYFCVDKDTVWAETGEGKANRVATTFVVNQTIDLKEDPGKKAI
ncbi:MAG: glutamine--tRNA ligase, partial [Olpidium bornovanus]